MAASDRKRRGGQSHWGFGWTHSLGQWLVAPCARQPTGEAGLDRGSYSSNSCPACMCLCPHGRRLSWGKAEQLSLIVPVGSKPPVGPVGPIKGGVAPTCSLGSGWQSLGCQTCHRPQGVAAGACALLPGRAASAQNPAHLLQVGASLTPDVDRYLLTENLGKRTDGLQASRPDGAHPATTGPGLGPPSTMTFTAGATRVTQADSPARAGWHRPCCLGSKGPGLRVPVPPPHRALPTGAAAGAARAAVHAVVLVLGLLLHRQLLQRGVDVQLVRLQLPQQRLSLQARSRDLSRERRRAPGSRGTTWQPRTGGAVPRPTRPRPGGWHGSSGAWLLTTAATGESNE